jgi:hypothetical protein
MLRSQLNFILQVDDIVDELHDRVVGRLRKAWADQPSLKLPKSLQNWEALNVNSITDRITAWSPSSGSMSFQMKKVLFSTQLTSEQIGDLPKRPKVQVKKSSHKSKKQKI